MSECPRITQEKHFDETTLEWVCPLCGRRIPVEYHVKNKRCARNKVYGTHQLMSLWSFYNFRRHWEACWRKHQIAGEQP